MFAHPLTSFWTHLEASNCHIVKHIFLLAKVDFPVFLRITCPSLLSPYGGLYVWHARCWSHLVKNMELERVHRLLAVGVLAVLLEGWSSAHSTGGRVSSVSCCKYAVNVAIKVSIHYQAPLSLGSFPLSRAAPEGRHENEQHVTSSSCLCPCLVI